MKHNALQTLGIVFVVAGIFLAITSTAGITGAVVGAYAPQDFVSFVAVVFVAVGLLLMMGKVPYSEERAMPLLYERLGYRRSVEHLTEQRRTVVKKIVSAGNRRVTPDNAETAIINELESRRLQGYNRQGHQVDISDSDALKTIVAISVPQDPAVSRYILEHWGSSIKPGPREFYEDLANRRIPCGSRTGRR
ncbi:MAG: hypothetical protein V1659_04810 [Candidatus Woesearchaeota archaeon]